MVHYWVLCRNRIRNLRRSMFLSIDCEVKVACKSLACCWPRPQPPPRAAPRRHHRRRHFARSRGSEQGACAGPPLPAPLSGEAPEGETKWGGGEGCPRLRECGVTPNLPPHTYNESGQGRGQLETGLSAGASISLLPHSRPPRASNGTAERGGAGSSGAAAASPGAAPAAARRLPRTPEGVRRHPKAPRGYPEGARSHPKAPRGHSEGPRRRPEAPEVARGR